VAVPAAALTVGLQGVGDAFKAIAAGDPEKIAAAMKNLAPAARDFVTQIQALAPAWKNLRLDVQQRLFEGLQGSIQNFAKGALPVLRAGLADNAAQLGEMGRGILYVAGSTQSLRDMGTVFSNVATSTRLAGDGTAAFTQMMIDLTTVGSAFLPDMARGFSDVAQAAADWISQARASGQLGQIIEVGLERLKSLADLVFAVGKTLVAVFKPAIDAGADLITILTTVFDSFAKVANMDASQSSLTTFFQSIAGLVKTIQPGPDCPPRLDHQRSAARVRSTVQRAGPAGEHDLGCLRGHVHEDRASAGICRCCRCEAVPGSGPVDRRLHPARGNHPASADQDHVAARADPGADHEARG
jgi:hypothetical protein